MSPLRIKIHRFLGIILIIHFGLCTLMAMSNGSPEGTILFGAICGLNYFTLVQLKKIEQNSKVN